MPTNNPKVSAYIPQHIFDRFKQFYEERDISMSQAVAVIFAEHFQLDLQVNSNSSSPITEAALARLDTLEKEVQDLKSNSKLPSSILSDLQNLNYLVNQIEGRLSEVEVNQISEPNTGLQGGLPKVSQEDDSVKQLTILEAVENPSEGDRDQDTSEEVQVVEDLIVDELPNNLISELQSNPLSSKLLALRLGVNNSSFSSKKNSVSQEEFYQWVKEKDPDHIDWEPVGGQLKGYSKGWLPASGTPSELLGRLSDWMKNNL